MSITSADDASTQAVSPVLIASIVPDSSLVCEYCGAGKDAAWMHRRQQGAHPSSLAFAHVEHERFRRAWMEVAATRPLWIGLSSTLLELPMPRVCTSSSTRQRRLDRQRSIPAP